LEKHYGCRRKLPKITVPKTTNSGIYAVRLSCRQKKNSAKRSKPPVCIFPKLHPERKMSKYQPFKKVDRRCLNFLKEKKLQKKYNFEYFSLDRSSVRKARAFLYQKGLKILLHASKVMVLQPVEARV
jgi:hypothetical protein